MSDISPEPNAPAESVPSSEPHLHLHAQRPGQAEAPVAAEPLALRIGGRFPVRDDRIAGREW